MSAPRWLDRLAAWWGVRQCRAGNHATLVWLTIGERSVPITNPVLEMMYAAGFQRLAIWNGWCPRCGQAVEWADHDPIRDMDDSDAIRAHDARRAYHRDQHRQRQALRRVSSVDAAERDGGRP